MIHWRGTDRIIRKAYEQAAGGKVDDAVAILRESSRESDPDGRYTEAIGMILYQAGRWSEAAECLLRALQIKPGDAQRMFYYASASSRAGEWEKALRILEEEAHQDTSSVAPIATKCLILLERGETAAAREAYKHAQLRFNSHHKQDAYAMGLLEQCAESLSQAKNETATQPQPNPG